MSKKWVLAFSALVLLGLSVMGVSTEQKEANIVPPQPIAPMEDSL